MLDHLASSLHDRIYFYDFALRLWVGAPAWREEGQVRAMHSCCLLLDGRVGAALTDACTCRPDGEGGGKEEETAAGEHDDEYFGSLRGGKWNRCVLRAHVVAAVCCVRMLFTAQRRSTVHR